MKTILSAIYYWGLSKPEDFQTAQRLIRDTEWLDVKQHISEDSTFLDIGCGKGYDMSMALKELDYHCVVVDPFPNYAGVEIDRSNFHGKRFYILEGCAEQLPIENSSVELVYNS